MKEEILFIFITHKKEKLKEKSWQQMDKNTLWLINVISWVSPPCWENAVSISPTLHKQNTQYKY